MTTVQKQIYEYEKNIHLKERNQYVYILKRVF